LAASVRAEPTAADKALAVSLFRDGRTLMDQGRFAEACSKLEESQRVDPGGGTLLNVALCHEKQGRTATAWAEFVEALGIARRDNRTDRIPFAEEHIEALEPNLAAITLVVSAEADDPGLELRRDGAVVGRAAWGTPIPVDPGDHLVQASAPGRKTWKTTITVGGSGPSKPSVSIPPLLHQDTPTPVPPVDYAASPGHASGSGVFVDDNGAGASDVAPTSGGSAQRTWGIIALGVGAVGIGAGSVFGITAMSKKRDSDAECKGTDCSAKGVALNDDAGKFADYATIGFGVGIGGALLGTILLLTESPSSHRASARSGSFSIVPVAGANGARLHVTGSF
jgi:hypothetical protein